MIKPPENQIIVSWEKREGFRYPQPIERLNGKSFFEYTPGSEEVKNWYKYFLESKQYDDAKKYCNYDSDLWTNETAKNNAAVKIHNYITSGKSGTGSNVTPLFPFEIYLMNDGFKMLDFCELSALVPGVSIMAKSMIADKIINPKGLCYSRCYSKNNNFIYLAFGIEVNKKKTNFYFKTSKSTYAFQVDNDINNYKKAINGLLKPLNDPAAFGYLDCN